MMSTDGLRIATECSADSGKVRLLSLADLDGRTRAAQRADRLHSDLLADLGGADIASAAQHELAQRAAVLGAIIQDSEARYLRGELVDLSGHLASLNAYRRLLATLGLERRTKPLRSFHDFIEGEAV